MGISVDYSSTLEYYGVTGGVDGERIRYDTMLLILTTTKNKPNYCIFCRNTGTTNYVGLCLFC